MSRLPVHSQPEFARRKPTVENKLTYMNDVLGNLFGVLQKIENENSQLKKLTALLLHFKQMLRFAVSKCNFGNLWGSDHDAVSFKADYDGCLAEFALLVEEIGLQFVSEIENRYQAYNDSETGQYFAYKNLQNDSHKTMMYFSNVSDHFQTKKMTAANFMISDAVVTSNSKSKRQVTATSARDTMLNATEENVATDQSSEDFLESEYSNHGGDFNAASNTESEPEYMSVKLPPASRPTKDKNSSKRGQLAKTSSLPRSASKRPNSTIISSSTRLSTRINKQMKAETSFSKKNEVQKQSKGNMDNQLDNFNISKCINDSFRSLFSRNDSASTSGLNTNQKTSDRLSFLANSPLYKLKSKKMNSSLTAEIVSSSENQYIDSKGSTSTEELITMDHSKLSKSVDVSLFYEIRQDGDVKQYTCAIPGCDCVDNQKLFMVAHILKHFNLKPLGCSHCEYRTDMRKYLLRHASRYHQITAELFPYMDYFGTVQNADNGLCSFVCKFSASCQFEAEHTALLMEHVHWHLGQNPFKCAFCEARFPELNLIKQHLWNNHRGQNCRSVWGTVCKSGEKQSLCCPYGNCTFAIENADREEMLNHIKDHHRFIAVVPYQPFINQAQSSTSIKRAFNEEINIGELQPTAKKQRTSIFENVLNDPSNALDEYDNAQEQLNDVSRDIASSVQQLDYSCSYRNCRFKSASWSHVKAHEYRRHMRQVFQCSEGICNEMEFENKEQLNKHLLDQHGISQFRCGVLSCNRAFTSSSQLKYHMKEDHTDAYLTCSKCQKLFKSRLTMMKHYRVNHVEGEYNCQRDDCHFVGQFRADLDRHISAAHSKMKVCPIAECSQVVHCSIYQAHMNRHYHIKNNVCSWPECGKAFVDRKSLKDHLRIHVGYKRFKCKWEGCGYASEQRSNTIKHIRIRHLKLPYTLREQLEREISTDQRPQDYLEVLPDDVNI